MIISLLGNEKQVPLDAAGPDWIGLTAVVRPLDTEELGMWADMFPTEARMRTAAIAIVKQQLLRIDGADVDTAGTPFDPKNAAHFRAVFSAERQGAVAIRVIYEALLARTTVGAREEELLDSPSGSAAPTATEA